MLKDNFGTYEITLEYIEPSNNKLYEFRKYVNSTKIKMLGGMYAIYCEEDNSIIFRKSDYLRDKSFPKFVEGRCEDTIDVTKEIDNQKIISYYESKNKKSIIYHLPGKIDKSKLTDEEFQILRKLIKKGAVEN